MNTQVSRDVHNSTSLFIDLGHMAVDGVQAADMRWDAFGGIAKEGIRDRKYRACSAAPLIFRCMAFRIRAAMGVAAAWMRSSLRVVK